MATIQTKLIQSYKDRDGKSYRRLMWGQTEFRLIIDSTAAKKMDLVWMWKGEGWWQREDEERRCREMQDCCVGEVLTCLFRSCVSSTNHIILANHEQCKHVWITNDKKKNSLWQLKLFFLCSPHLPFSFFTLYDVDIFLYFNIYSHSFQTNHVNIGCKWLNIWFNLCAIQWERCYLFTVFTYVKLTTPPQYDTLKNMNINVECCPFGLYIKNDNKMYTI